MLIYHKHEILAEYVNVERVNNHESININEFSDYDVQRMLLQANIWRRHAGRIFLNFAFMLTPY